LVPQKGVDTFLQALAQTPEAVRALIVGSGPSETDLRSLAIKLGIADRVEWRGYVDHLAMPETYAEMDLLVVPSRTTDQALEQFGRVVIEALACGVPVCSSDSGEPPTLIAQTGGGWTFHEDSADELAELLRWAGENRRELRRRAKAGSARVSELFSSDAVAESFADAVRRYALKQAE
jgi:glycosyltransferase involved in cell wall biosynthesis